MVDIARLKARMVLKGYNQRTLAAACREKGYKTSENTIYAKMNGRSPWTSDDIDMMIDMLEIDNPADKVEIFLA